MTPKQAFDELVRLHEKATHAWVYWAQSAPGEGAAVLHKAAVKADAAFREALARLFDQPARME